MSLKYRYELRKWAGERLCHDSSTMHSFGAPHRGNIAEMPEQDDLEIFYCPECGNKCDEEGMLDGSNVGITLLMKCTHYTCSNFFRVTYNSYSLIENIVPF